MRIALFAPNQPTKSGIATYTAALLPWMARRHRVLLRQSGPHQAEGDAPGPRTPQGSLPGWVGRPSPDGFRTRWTANKVS